MSHNNCRSGVLLVALIWVMKLELFVAIDRCQRPDDLPNGFVLQRRSYIRFRCNNHYSLMGRLTIGCGSDGRLKGERPFCARAGCRAPLDPDNGSIEVQRGLKAVIICKEEFVVAGNALSYCNGYTWDRPLGICRHENHTHSHACDFESEDLCGWSSQLSYLTPWRRVATVGHFHSYRTGPRHDHTLKSIYGGHYMLVETAGFDREVHHLVSPIYPRDLSLKTACCFRFHYFMYGSGVGELVISVKSNKLHVDAMWDQKIGRKFSVSGNQGNQWLEHTISIDEMSQDFQIVITVVDAGAQFGDIAIDDVQLITGSECGSSLVTTTTETPVQESVEPVVYDIMNCSQRCFLKGNEEDYFLDNNRLIKACSCELSCFMSIDKCCPDFFSTCLYDDDTTVAQEITTRTTTPTPTTPKPTTLRTTTPKPTTLRTTTQEPTTPKPTTSTTRKIPQTTRTTTTSTRRTTPTTTSTTTTTTTTTTTAAPTTKRLTSNTSSTSTTTTTPKSTTISASTARTTTTTTTTKITPNTIGNSSRPVKKPEKPVTHRSNVITWEVHPGDLQGDIDRPSGHALLVWIVVLSVICIIIVTSVAYRWERTKRATIEKAVSFQKNLAKLKLANRIKGAPNEANAPLCDTTTDNADYEDDLQIEEMGVDIRNITEL